MELATEAVAAVHAALRLRMAPDQAFGLAVATVEGEVHGAGQWRHPFAIQSIAKVFALAQVLAVDGDNLWARVGRRPSSRSFHSLSELDLEAGVPRNPMLNSGSLVVTDRLLEISGGQACHAVLDFLRVEAANPAIEIDADVAKSEEDAGDRNLAIAHLLAAQGNLRLPVRTVFAHYVWQCAITADCQDLALASLFLARDGVRIAGTPFLTSHAVRAINATMLMCGAYETSAEVMHRVGMPLKTGVGGGIIAVAPGRGTVCAWAPGLDAAGNSIIGLQALAHFASLTGWTSL